MNYDINTFLLAQDRSIEFVKNHAHFLHVDIRRHLFKHNIISIKA